MFPCSAAARAGTVDAHTGDFVAQSLCMRMLARTELGEVFGDLDDVIDSMAETASSYLPGNTCPKNRTRYIAYDQAL